MSKHLTNLECLRILEEHLTSDPSKYTIEKKSPPLSLSEFQRASQAIPIALLYQELSNSRL